MKMFEKLIKKYPQASVVDVRQPLNALDFKHQKRKQLEKHIEGGAIGVAWLSDSEIVLTHRTKPHPGWALPGGRVEEDEEFEEAFIRELEEETTVKCKVESLLVIERKVFVAPGGEELPLVLAVFNAIALPNQKARNTEEALFEGLKIATYNIAELPKKMILKDRYKIELAVKHMEKNSTT